MTELESFPTEIAKSGKNGGGGNRTREPFPTESAHQQGFSYSEEINLDLTIVVDDHVSLRGPDDIYVWGWPLEMAKEWLERTLAAITLAQEANDG